MKLLLLLLMVVTSSLLSVDKKRYIEAALLAQKKTKESLTDSQLVSQVVRASIEH